MTTRPVLTRAELDARDRVAAETLLTEADHALTSNDFDHALALIDQAEQHYPGWNYDSARDAVRQSQREHRPPQPDHTPVTVDAGQPPDQLTATSHPRSRAAAAFTHTPHLDTRELSPPDPASLPQPATSRPMTR